MPHGNLSRRGTPRRTLTVLAIAASLVSGCTLPTTSPGTSESAIATTPTALRFCVSEINRYRALMTLPPLDRSTQLEAYATESAQVDAVAGEPHTHFIGSNGGGVARAENELLAWPNFDVLEVIRQGLATMWAEGPSGEHYKIMVGPYTEVGCGLAVTTAHVTIAQDFR